MNIEEKIIYRKMLDFIQNKYGETIDGECEERKDMLYYIDTLKSKSTIEYYFDFNQSETCSYPRIRLFLKRIIRRLNKFLLMPICKKQSKFNTDMLSLVEKIYEENNKNKIDYEKTIKTVHYLLKENKKLVEELKNIKNKV